MLAYYSDDNAPIIDLLDQIEPVKIGTDYLDTTYTKAAEIIIEMERKSAKEWVIIISKGDPLRAAQILQEFAEHDPSIIPVEPTLDNCTAIVGEWVELQSHQK